MAETLNDVKYRALGALGYSGTLNEREYQFYVDGAGGGGGGSFTPAANIPYSTSESIDLLRVHFNSLLTSMVDVGLMEPPAETPWEATFIAETHQNGMGGVGLKVAPFDLVESIYLSGTTVRLSFFGDTQALANTIPFTTIWLNGVSGDLVSHTIYTGKAEAVYDIPITLGETYTMYFSIS